MQKSIHTTTLLPRLALALTLLLSIAACSTLRDSTATQERVATRDTFQYVLRQFDSVYIDRYHSMIANDSVVTVRDSVIQYRLCRVHDSIYVNKTDTMYIDRDKYVVQEVPRPLAWYDYVAYLSLIFTSLVIYRKARDALRT